MVSLIIVCHIWCLERASCMHAVELTSLWFWCMTLIVSGLITCGIIGSASNLARTLRFKSVSPPLKGAAILTSFLSIQVRVWIPVLLVLGGPICCQCLSPVGISNFVSSEFVGLSSCTLVCLATVQIGEHSLNVSPIDLRWKSLLHCLCFVQGMQSMWCVARWTLLSDESFALPL